MQQQYEHANLTSSYLKHVTGLSAGAIVLQIGFVEKLIPYPKIRLLLAVSLISFTVAIVSSTAVQWYLLESVRSEGKDVLWPGVLAVLMGLCFILGLVTAVVFALINLFSI